jgi:hypothetical protein
LPKLYNVQPDGTCGLPGQFLSITVTGTSGSLANTACSLEAQGFPDPQPEEDCDGLLFGKECSQLAAGLVLTVGGFGKGTDGPDVSALLRLLGLSRLESVGGLFFDVGDGAKVKHVDALPRLARVGPGGLQPGALLTTLLARVPEMRDVAVGGLKLEVPFNLDSSRVGPPEWVILARALDAARASHDAFLIIHGTDTLAYTAAALSYALAG